MLEPLTLRFSGIDMSIFDEWYVAENGWTIDMLLMKASPTKYSHVILPLIIRDGELRHVAYNGETHIFPIDQNKFMQAYTTYLFERDLLKVQS